MKLIIDIPEEDYNNIEPLLNGETIKGGFNFFKTLEIIKNGTPLDNIMSEIEEAKEIMDDLENGSYYAIRMDDLRDIINKHIGKGSEEIK